MRCAAVTLFVALLAVRVFAEPPTAEPPAAAGVDVHRTIERGVAFLAKDAVAWRDEHHCASCHHAALIAWSLREAKERGHAVDEPVLAEMTKWLTEAGAGKTGVPRPEGIPKALNVKAVLFSLGLEAKPQPSEVEQAALTRMLGTVKSDQTDDGSWDAWPETRPPIFGPSDEAMTALATLALLPAAGSDEAAAKAHDRGLAWLAAQEPSGDQQGANLRLLLWCQAGRPAAEREALVTRIALQQRADGGWSQTPEMASDAFVTGQALYALAHAGRKGADPVVQRAQAFLAKTQARRRVVAHDFAAGQGRRKGSGKPDADHRRGERVGSAGPGPQRPVAHFARWSSISRARPAKRLSATLIWLVSLPSRMPTRWAGRAVSRISLPTMATSCVSPCTSTATPVSGPLSTMRLFSRRLRCGAKSLPRSGRNRTPTLPLPSDVVVDDQVVGVAMADRDAVAAVVRRSCSSRPGRT